MRVFEGELAQWCGGELELEIGIGIASVRMRQGLREGSVPF